MTDEAAWPSSPAVATAVLRSFASTEAAAAFIVKRESRRERRRGRHAFNQALLRIEEIEK